MGEVESCAGVNGSVALRTGQTWVESRLSHLPAVWLVACNPAGPLCPPLYDGVTVTVSVSQSCQDGVTVWEAAWSVSVRPQALMSVTW